MVYAAQPREGTETIPAKSFATWVLLVLVYAAQPREGTETLINLGQHGSTRHNVVYAAQPREGTETILGMIIISYMHDTLVYAAQPREGTETPGHCTRLVPTLLFGFMQLNPARGRKPYTKGRPHTEQPKQVYAAQPREGTETRPAPTPLGARSYQSGLCSSTPRGDGNWTCTCTSLPSLSTVYAAQPREGTETRSLLSAALGQS